MNNITLSYIILHNQKVFVLNSISSDKYILIKDDYICELDESELCYYKDSLKAVHSFYAYLGSIPVIINDSLIYCGLFINSATQIGIFNKVIYFKITDIAIVYFMDNNLCVYSVSDKNFSSPFESIRNLTEIAKLITNGLFYFAYNNTTHLFHDIAMRLDNSDSIKEYRKYFIWNRNMINIWHLSHIKNYYCYIAPIISGSVDIQSIICNGSKCWDKTTDINNIKEDVNKIKKGINPRVECNAFIPIRIQILLISRLSWVRAGTRYNVRGINDDGFVANYVETEQVLLSDGIMASFCQIRGSVPLFWSQTGLQMGSHRINIDRNPICSFEAFYKHFERLSKTYSNIFVLNLLNNKKDEAVMSFHYQNLAASLPASLNCQYLLYDYQLEFESNNLDCMWDSLKSLHAFLSDNGCFIAILKKQRNIVIAHQTGIVRSNCVDCLDRTNAMQTKIALKFMANQISSIGVFNLPPATFKRFEDILRGMWLINGNNCSLNYAGTEALEKSKFNMASKIRDSAVSIKRAFINNFMDDKRNYAISFFSSNNQTVLTLSPFYSNLGWCYLPTVMRTDSICPSEIILTLLNKYKEYIETTKINISVATWNVNGGVTKTLDEKSFFNSALQDWLLYPHKKFPQYQTKHFNQNINYSADIIIIGIQEIVDLTASNIIANSFEQRDLWGKVLHRYLSKERPYTLVTASQLVGVCIFMFATPEIIPDIRDVSTVSVKTGLKGAAGNKGAIGISCTIKASQFCFVCSHFAAGSNSASLSQRNQDFYDIYSQMIFDRDINASSHDFVFWCGDLNYRVNLPPDNAKFLAANNNIFSLTENDQLKSCMSSFKVFDNFEEGEINFLPTYKYDTGSNMYDSSEKNRTPSYTDRILWKSSTDNGGVIQLYYGRGESRASDHRPVVSLFQVPIKETNYNKLLLSFEHILDEFLYTFQTVRYVCNLESITETRLNATAKEACELFPGVQFYRVCKNMIYLTFTDGKKIHELPKLITLNGCKFVKEIVPTLNLKKADEYVLDALKELCIKSDNILLKKSGLNILNSLSPKDSELENESKESSSFSISNTNTPPSKPNRPPRSEKTIGINSKFSGSCCDSSCSQLTPKNICKNYSDSNLETNYVNNKFSTEFKQMSSETELGYKITPKIEYPTEKTKFYIIDEKKEGNTESSVEPFLHKASSSIEGTKILNKNSNKIHSDLLSLEFDIPKISLNSSSNSIIFSNNNITKVTNYSHDSLFDFNRVKPQTDNLKKNISPILPKRPNDN